MTTDRAPAQPKKRVSKKSLVKPLNSMIGSVGLGVSMVNQADGFAIISGADRLSRALDKWAKESDAVYRTLEAMLTVGTAAEVAAAVGAILVPIAANHGFLPREFQELLAGSMEAPGEAADEDQRFDFDQPEQGDSPNGNPWVAQPEPSLAADD